MRISSQSKYGLRALAYLAHERRVVSIAEISQKEKIPADFLEKIFAKFKRAKIVAVKRGQHGGYFLADSPKKISVGQIVAAVEKIIAPSFCVSDKTGKKCSCSLQKNCLTKDVWKKVQITLLKTLNSISLADLINKY